MSEWYQTLKKSLENSRTLVEELQGGRKVTWGEIFANSLMWKRLFEGNRSKVVTVILPNSVDYLSCYLGVVGSGNIFNPVPYFIGMEELDKIFSYSEPVHIVTDRSDIIAKYSSGYSLLTPGISLKEASSSGFNPEDTAIASLYYSSGSTGNPKGVLYSHKNTISLIESICHEFGFSEKTRQFAFLPFGHTASINYNIFPAMLRGSYLLISRSFEEIRTRFFEVLSEYKITYTQAVPSVVLMLNSLKCRTGHLDLGHFPFLGCGSSVLPLEAQKTFQARYGIKVSNLYGLSESGPSHIDDPTEPGWEPGSIGRPLGVNLCRLASDGEIQLRGDNIFAGYYKNEKLYRETVVDGWFSTGDIGCQVGEKYYFTDRKKDLIIKSGINIVPSEIEEVIYGSGLVKECVVVGKPHRIHGETVMAALVFLRDQNEDEKKLTDAVRAHCKKHLSQFKIPSDFIVVEKLPQTHSGKFMRKKIREQYAR